MYKIKNKLIVLFTLIAFVCGMTALLLPKAFAEGENTPTEITWPTTFAVANWSGNTELRLPTTQFSGGSGSIGASDNAENHAKIKIMRNEQVFACSNLYCWGSSLTFYFNGSNYTGLNATRGDILKVDAGFEITFNGTDYISTNGINYIFTGTNWIEGTELPSVAPVIFSSPTTTESEYAANGFTMRIDLNTNVTVALNDTKTDVKNQVNVTNVTYTRNQKSVSAGAVHGYGTLMYIYFKDSEDLTFTNGSSLKGDILTMGKDFSFAAKDGTTLYKVESDQKFIFTGARWIKGDTLPEDVKVKSVIYSVAEYPTNFPVQVKFDTDVTNPLGNGLDLKGVYGAQNITYTRGANSVTTGVFHAMGTIITAYFKSGNGITFNTSESLVGDLVTIGAGFGFNDNAGATTYEFYETVKYVYDGENWVIVNEPVTAINAEKDSEKLYLGKTIEIAFTTVPENVALPIVYTVEDDTVATVTGKGLKALVVGEKIGSTKLTATYGEVSKTITLNVVAVPVLESISVTPLTIMQFDKIDYTKTHGTCHYVGSEDTTNFDVTAEMISGTIKNDVAGEFELTVTYENKTALLKVTVTEAKKLSVKGVSWGPFSRLEVDFGTTTANTTSDTATNQTAMAAFYSFSGGAVKDILIYGQKLEVGIAKGDGYFKQTDLKIGDILTIKKGAFFKADERVAEDISFVYNGEKFVKLVEPADFTISEETNTSVHVGAVIKIKVKAAENVTAIYKYSVDDTTKAKIDETGKLTGLAIGKVTVTVSYKTISRTINVNILPEAEKKSLVIESNIEKYYVPVSTTDKPSSFLLSGYELFGHYEFADGSISDSFAIPEDWICDADYTKAAEINLKITDTANSLSNESVVVKVYSYETLGAFDTIGVSGYDVNDKRNAVGTWNGHMIISMSSFSKNTANLLSTDESGKMSEFIEYRTADGKVYTKESNSLGIWVLGTNLLVMIKPEGYTGNMGFGTVDKDGSTEAKGEIPIYKTGDKIIFKKGMPVYAWDGKKTVGNADGSGANIPIRDSGVMYIQGYTEEDWTYYCYEQTSEKSLWMLYKEYGDFTVSEKVTVVVGEAKPVGAVRNPIDSTTGKFTYKVADGTVLTISESGNMVGMKVGKTTVTVTLAGGFKEDGTENVITKTIEVTVVRGIKKVTPPEIKAKVGKVVDLSKYSLTIEYTDGTTENIQLDDKRVVVEDIDTSATGEISVRVRITVENITKTVNMTVNVTKGGCGAISLSGALISLVTLLGCLLIFKRKQK